MPLVIDNYPSRWSQDKYSASMTAPGDPAAGGSGGADTFVVQRGRTVPTLSSINTSEKEQLNQDTKSEERGEEEDSLRRASVFDQMKNIPVAGRPSESPRRSGLGGARRNSVSENTSQLSLENLGGSQEHLHLLGRNPDKEMKTHSGRREGNYMDNREAEELEKAAREGSPYGGKQYSESTEPPAADRSGEKVSFADLRKQKARDHFHTSGININYMGQEKEDSPPKTQPASGHLSRSNSQRETSANLTSWASQNYQPQSAGSASREDANRSSEENPDAMASQLNSVRMKLEQRRKRIEEEKKKMESIMARQREKVGQEAFLRAVGATNRASSSNSTSSSPVRARIAAATTTNNAQMPTKDESPTQLQHKSLAKKSVSENTPPPPPSSASASNRAVYKLERPQPAQRPVTLKDLTDDLSAVQSRWLSERNGGAPRFNDMPSSVRTPDVEAMDMDTYSRSLTAMNDSLHDLQSDIQRLAVQQSQIQQMMRQPTPHQSTAAPANPMDPQPFYIAHEPPQQRRTWGQPQPINFAHQQVPPPPDHMMTSPRRQQWGQQQAPPPRQPYGYYSPNDPYTSPMRGNDPYMYNGNSPYESQQTGYAYGNGSAYSNSTPGYAPMPYGPTSSYGNTSYMSPSSANPPTSRGAPFRLHEGKPSPQSPQVPSSGSLSRTPSSAYGGSPLRHGPESEAQPTLPPAPMRQTSRDSLGGSHPASNPVSAVAASPSPSPHRLHSSVPAPEEDDMAPQNVSFISAEPEEAADEADQRSMSPADPMKRLPERLSQLNITSGSKTYRVHSSSDKETSPSPTRQRPTISSTFKQNRRNSSDAPASGPSSIKSTPGVSQMTEEEAETYATMKTERLKDDADAAKGFVISFDTEGPKKPKPMLKPRRPSKRLSMTSTHEMNSDGSNSSRKENVPPEVMICIDLNMGSDEGNSGHRSSSPPYRKFSSPGRNGAASGSPTRSMDSGSNWRTYDHNNHHEPSLSSSEHHVPVPKFELDPNAPLETMATIGAAASSESEQESKNMAVIIGDALVQQDPLTADEMQRKKERILMQSLRRKQQQEDARLRKEDEARRKKEEEKAKEEEKLRKKEEEKARRDAILEQHRMKKEMEKMAEEQGRMPEPVSARPVPKLRSSSTVGRTRSQRPKTIHVDQDGDLGMALAHSRGPRGSSSNISGMHRSDSRQSINDLSSPRERGGGVGGLSIASMGTARRGLSTAGYSGSSRPGSRPASRRGSNQYLNEDHHASERLPPSGLAPRTMDWAARQAAARRKQSQSSAVEDSPRVSRLDRNARSVSQPRGKRDSSVSSAYGVRERDFRGSRESLNSGLTYSARRGSQASIYNDENDYYYGGSMRDLSGRQPGRRKSSSASHIDIVSYRSGTAASTAKAVGSLRSLSHFNSLKRGSASGPGMMAKSRSFANLSGSESSTSISLAFGADDSGLESASFSAQSSTTPQIYSPRGSLVGCGGAQKGHQAASSRPGPGSLPGYRRRGDFDDGASDISSTASGFSAYGYRSGTRLYREPASKSNRTIILNAIEYVVFPGAVNKDTRERVLDIVDRCDCPHFLLLFRDQKCQFRGLYAYYPDTEEVYKIYGTGPKQVSDKMFDTFFKYNSGGKKFTKIHTKHLTVTIDAFTIHNSLWLGKKAKLPDKKDMALVI